MDNSSSDLVAVFAAHTGQTFAWCLLPNHYHALVEAPDIKALPRELGLLNGRTAHAWNGEEHVRGKFSSALSNARCDRTTILGDAESFTSQSRAARVRGALDKIVRAAAQRSI